jgi:hypothetical protein
MGWFAHYESSSLSKHSRFVTNDYMFKNLRFCSLKINIDQGKNKKQFHLNVQKQNKQIKATIEVK